MPSKSKAQQRFMGLVHAYNKGDVKGSEVSKKVKDTADSMKKSDVKKYASTTHKGKPEKVKKEAIDKLKEMIRMELEGCGYVMSAEDPNYKLKSPGGTGEEDRRLKKENVLNEMDYRGFVKYMNDFYGPKGVYPDKKKRTLKMKDIGIAYSVLLKKKPNFEIGYDSTDREFLRDILIKMKKLDPDYSQKESVNESKELDTIEKIVKSAKNFMDVGRALKKVRIKSDFQTSMGLPRYTFKLNGKRYGILNKKNVSKPDRVVGDIAFGVMESINEGKGVEKVLKMANDHSFGKLGGRTVDALSAGLFKGVYDKASDKNKEKINKMNEKQLYVFMTKLWSKFGRQVKLT